MGSRLPINRGLTMLTQDAELLIKESTDFLRAFGLTREFATEKPKVFPYGNNTAIMNKKFDDLCPSYDSYSEYLAYYKLYINRIELMHKAISNEMYKNFALTFLCQSYLARLGNTATKLIWLRRCGKSWRWDTIQKLREADAA